MNATELLQTANQLIAALEDSRSPETTNALIAELGKLNSHIHRFLIESSPELEPVQSEGEEPEIDDTVHVCPDCERPNQFGELCDSCRQEADIRHAENHD